MTQLSKTRRRWNAAILVAAFGCAQSATADEVATPPVGKYDQASEAYDAGRWADAVVKIREAVAAEPSDPRAAPIRVYLADALIRDGRPQDAVVELRDLLQSTSDADVDAAAERLLVVALHVAGDHRAIVAEGPALLDAQADREEALVLWRLVAHSAFALGDYDTAESAAAFFTASCPDHRRHDDTAYLQAAALYQLGRPASAWTIVSSRLPPADSPQAALVGELLAALGDDAAAAGRDDEAARHYRRLLADYPRHRQASYAAFRLAESAAARSDWESAAEQFAALAEHCDRSELVPPARLGQVQALAQARRWDEVLTVAEAAARRHSDWSRVYEFHYLRGRAHIAKAELDAARTAFAAVLDSPNSADTESAVLARFMTAETHYLQRAYAAALADYERVAKSDDFAAWRDAAVLQCEKCREQLNLQRK